MLDLCAGADGPADALADALERSTPAGTRPPRIVLSDLYRRARGVAGRARPASPGDRSGRRAGRCHAHPRRSGAGPRADHRQRLPSFPAAAGRGDPGGRRARLGGHLRERGLRPNTARLAGVRASRPRGARRNAAAHTTCRPCASIAPRTARMVAHVVALASSSGRRSGRVRLSPSRTGQAIVPGSRGERRWRRTFSGGRRDGRSSCCCR